MNESDVTLIEAAQYPESLDRFLAARAYRDWPSWSEVGETLGPGGARVYLNPALYASLQAGESVYPVGAGAVRELYAEDFTTLTGYSALVKLAHPAEAESWLCFERLNLTPDGVASVSSPGAPGCTGCHGEREDFIHSRLPLP